jgi:hypothetical protein
VTAPGCARSLSDFGLGAMQAAEQRLSVLWDRERAGIVLRR